MEAFPLVTLKKMQFLRILFTFWCIPSILCSIKTLVIKSEESINFSQFLSSLQGASLMFMINLERDRNKFISSNFIFLFLNSFLIIIERGHELTIKSKGQSSSTPLIQFEEMIYDNLAILDSTASCKRISF